ncbi:MULTISPECIES: restriction endonuclease subunit S [Citrobacter]|uniref:restriction endonuclease subunit S n=1 Tax=Citrobacter TaxID=544 RepID=UPI0023AF788D|nr:MULTISPECIES: restriction endonuclease subunit S [Citrobacter]EIQ7158221.1 restriction endonuclease subunit S [Citrobacter sedlakii]MDT7072162.1 restriction endonuclease subunit S [Citrobacter amalonaticus]HCD7552602.1 restriction endonuclease subunit S [Citrobacter farmeri]
MAKYKAYPEYKDSGVEWLGEVPNHWKTVSISRLFSRIKRTGYTEKELLSVYRDYGVIPKSSRDDNNNKPSEDLSPYQLVEPNDLVMNKMKAWQGSIAISEYEGIVSPAYFVYKPNNVLFELAHPRYVHYLLRNPIYVTQYLSRSKGIRVNQWDLDPDEFRNIELLLPDKTEQEKIYSFLDHETAKIDNLIEKQQQLIELLKEKRQAVISHAVTKGLNPDVPMKDSGVEWLGEVPAHWTVSTIKHISTFIGTGGTPKNSESFTDDDGIDWFSPGDFNGSLSLRYAKKKITTQAVSNGDAKSYPKDSIVVIGIGATLGKVAFVEHEFSCNQQINIITPSKTVDHKYLTYSLLNQVEQMKQSSNASTIGIMNQEKTKQIWIAVPPKDEQIKIVSVLSQKEIEFDELLKKSEYQILLLQERRTALISAAVTGKIDVRDWGVPNTQDIEEPEEAIA